MSETDVDHIPPVGLNVLLALAEYRFLTTNQLLDLGVAKDRGYLGKILSGFLSAQKDEKRGGRRAKEIGELDYGVRAGQGRLPRMYYLTQRGAELLSRAVPELPPVQFPRRVLYAAHDYNHKVRTIDFHIALSSWARHSDQDIAWILQYFDWHAKSGKSQPHTKTRIQISDRAINPDSIFMLTDPNGIERLYCFEMANGMDAGRVIKQMQNYCRGLDEGSINHAFHFGNRAVRVLHVFEHPRLLELVQARAKSDRWLEKYAAHFFLKTCADIRDGDFRALWKSVEANSSDKELF